MRRPCCPPSPPRGLRGRRRGCTTCLAGQASVHHACLRLRQHWPERRSLSGWGLLRLGRELAALSRARAAETGRAQAAREFQFEPAAPRALLPRLRAAARLMSCELGPKSALSSQLSPRATRRAARNICRRGSRWRRQSWRPFEGEDVGGGSRRAVRTPSVVRPSATTLRNAGDRAHPGWPVRQPDRCQVLGGEARGAAGSRVAQAAVNAVGWLSHANLGDAAPPGTSAPSPDLPRPHPWITWSAGRVRRARRGPHRHLPRRQRPAGERQAA